MPSYEERITPIRGIKMRNIKVGETSTPFRILGDERLPVENIELDKITINTVRGQKNRYENTKNVRESKIKISTFIEEPDKVNKNM